MRLTGLNSLKWRLTLVIMTTCGATLLIAALAVVWYDSMLARSFVVSQITTLAEITSANADSALWFDDAPIAQESINTLRKRPEIIAAAFYRSDGRRFVQYSRDGSNCPAKLTVDKNRSSHFEDGELALQLPVYFDHDLVGAIYVRADPNQFESPTRSQKFLKIAELTLLGLLGVALLLAALLQRLISDPIVQLADTARQITTKSDYSVRAQIRGYYEIGSLVTSFNVMVSEIERQNRAVRSSEERWQFALEGADEGVWDWNPQTNEVYFSPRWKAMLGYEDHELPNRYEEWEQRLQPDFKAPILKELQLHLSGKKSLYVAEQLLRCKDGTFKWILARGKVMSYTPAGLPLRVIGTHTDISQRKQAEADYETLVARLLNSEEAERRRIARELHDTTAQHLVAIKMNLNQLSQSSAPNPSSQHDWLAESLQLVERSLQEIRTLTYVLHPPFLDELGLVGAIEDYAEGVARRSGLEIETELHRYAQRFPLEIELVLFRILQESLGNVLRHSTSKLVLIRLESDDEEIRLEVQDFGCGIQTLEADSAANSLRRTGVGITAMRERLRYIGGQLTIESDAEGVTVLAVVPVSRTAQPNGKPSQDPKELS